MSRESDPITVQGAAACAVVAVVTSCAVADRKSGQAVEMPSLYDEMSPRAAADYAGGTARQREMRGVLLRAMEAEGFTVLPEEWWHFDYRDWQSYAVQNAAFEDLAR